MPRPGDVSDAIRAVDEFCYKRSVMINVGDEKGLILDTAIAAHSRAACWSWEPTAATAPCARAGYAAGCAPVVD